ncbi:alpha/beta hydrolase family protein [Curvibacter delicatus]|jgi:predicted dienelactone hydrolase|uniref:alpha/beta hydrolase family protein n=1 Tax=Curvibacter delicatus TaxID=80879 RepID=UPI000AFCE37A|nr:dienelactone hydrolase [Curvibacter delicatus]
MTNTLWLPLLRLAALGAGALISLATQAAVGLDELPGREGDGPVTVFYPSSSPAQPVQRARLTLSVAPQGVPERGNGRLIVLSHGSGGEPWSQSDLALHLAGAGFVVALPEHAGDNWRDLSKIGPESWKLRPLEVTRAIDALGHDPRFAPLLDLQRVGVYGMSAGGHTALTLAGGRWSPARLRAHCDAHLAEDFVGCTGAASELTGGWTDSLKQSVARFIIHRKLQDDTLYGHTDPRIRAVVAAVPFAVDFDLDSLAHPVVPLALIEAGQDRWLLPQFHSGPVLAACSSCTRLALLPTGGHGALLAPLPPADKLPPRVARLLADPPGFDRAELPALYQHISSFFQKHLLP